MGSSQWTHLDCPTTDKSGGRTSKSDVMPDGGHLQVKARQLWGSDSYTHDSDLVAVLMHCGYVSNTAGVPTNSVHEMRVLVQYQPSRPFYPSVLKNGIRSRAWGMHIDGCCYKVTLRHCFLMSLTSGQEDLGRLPPPPPLRVCGF